MYGARLRTLPVASQVEAEVTRLGKVEHQINIIGSRQTPHKEGTPDQLASSNKHGKRLRL